MKQQAIVVVVDAASARAFRVLAPEPPETGLRIQEEEGLARPEARLKETERFSDSMPTGHRGGFGQAHAYDDHRDASDQEHRKSFARQVADFIAGEVSKAHPRQVIIAVSNSMQALLEQAVAKVPAVNQRAQWLMGEFTRLTPAQLQRELVSRQMLSVGSASA